MHEFLIHVAAGVFLAILGWVLARVLTPRFHAWLFSAPRLDGEWSLYDSDAETASSVGTVEIRQAGERLTGIVRRHSSRDGSPTSRKSEYRGQVRHGRVLLSFQQPDTGGFIAGYVVLKVMTRSKPCQD